MKVLQNTSNGYAYLLELKAEKSDMTTGWIGVIANLVSTRSHTSAATVSSFLQHAQKAVWRRADGDGLDEADVVEIGEDIHEQACNKRKPVGALTKAAVEIWGNCRGSPPSPQKLSTFANSSAACDRIVSM